MKKQIRLTLMLFVAAAALSVSITAQVASGTPYTLEQSVIASGGAGKPEHFTEVFENGKADAALAASIFHFREIEIPALKNYLRECHIEVRI